MSEPVTTYVLTFESSIPDDEDRRASLKLFLKKAKRAYGLRLVKMRTETAKRATKAKPKPSGRPYGELIKVANRRLDAVRLE